MEKIRSIKFFRHYFTDFYLKQTEGVRRKINFVLQMIETQRVIPQKFFRSIESADGIYEVRVEFEGNIYRVFCCMDKGAVVVLFHGFQKKTQKTPLKEIRKAETIRKEYISSKENI